MANLNLNMIAQLQDRASAGIKRLQGNVDKLNDRSRDLGATVSGIKIGVFAGLSGILGGIFASAVSTGREFEKLKATLNAVAPDGVDAADAFKLVQQITKQLPTDLATTTTAFTKMLALGIAPTEERMLSFGNTASAMGKDIMQFVEAVADAATGEFERLKEFGIKAASEGDNVSFTFQGATKTVKKSSADIVGYLEDIGNVQFAGAAATQMETLDGKLSNLGVAWDDFVNKIAEAGLFDVLKGIVDFMTDSITGLQVAGIKISAIFSRIGEDARYAGDVIKAAFTDSTIDEVIAEHERRVAILDQVEREMIAEARALDKIDSGAKRANDALKNLDKTNEKFEFKGLSVEAKPLQSLEEFVGEVEDQSARYIRSIENAMDAQQRFDELLQEGEITYQEYEAAMTRLNDILEIDTEDTVEQIEGFWQQAANNMQDTMGNVFFDWMQGRMTSLSEAFKIMLDRMVAELAASQLMQFLIGDFGSTGVIGGAIGSAISGFRADGGPVLAGRSYVVGEQGPELFTPTSNGMITANKDSSGTTNVNINVQSLDGADTMRVLEKSKREISEMILGTIPTYNMGAL